MSSSEANYFNLCECYVQFAYIYIYIYWNYTCNILFLLVIFGYQNNTLIIQSIKVLECKIHITLACKIWYLHSVAVTAKLDFLSNFNFEIVFSKTKNRSGLSWVIPVHCFWNWLCLSTLSMHFLIIILRCFS